MRTIRRIILHHTASPATWDAARIDREHRAKGWSQIGYHFVVLSSGEVQPGRPATLVGAHAKGANDDSLGVVLVGSFEAPKPPPPLAQWTAAVELVEELCEVYGLTWRDVYGHCEVGTTPTLCPGFSPDDFRRSLRGHRRGHWNPLSRLMEIA